MVHSILLALALLLGPPHYNRWKNHVPYRAHWGAYRIVVEQVGKDDSGGPQQVRICSSSGKTLREVRASMITEVNLVKLTGHSPADLHIALWSGGAYCCFTDVYFSRKGGLHNVLIFDAEDLDLPEVKDLNQDGIPEIIAQNPVLGDFSAYNFHRHWPVITILGWNGKRYVDVTRRYPQRSLQQAWKFRKDILEYPSTPAQYKHEWAFEDEVTAYYANMLSIGRGAQARRWLRKRLNSSEWAWLRQNEAELRHLVATAAQHRAYVSQKKVIEQR